MINQLTFLTVNVADKPYHILCNPSSTFGELKEAICQFSKFIEDLEEKAKKEAEEASKALENSKEADINV